MDHWASMTTEKRQGKESNTQAAGDESGDHDLIMATKETSVFSGPACPRFYNNNVIGHVVDRNMNKSGGSGPPATRVQCNPAGVCTCRLRMQGTGNEGNREEFSDEGNDE